MRARCPAFAQSIPTAMQFRHPKARNPNPPRGLSWGRASCLPQFDVKTLGLGRSGVFFHWSNRMVPKAIRHGAAVGESASISAPLKQDNDGIVETSIPARLDCLRWGGFHTRVVAALGITWILYGLEVTLAGPFSGAM